jgi:large subunit ribosomal protein L25
MSQTIELNAVVRERGGKGAARAVRRQGLVPGVIYGDKKEPQVISIDKRELQRLLNTGTFMTTLCSIDVGGAKTRVLARDVQFDPVKDFPIHVDFLRLGKGARISLDIPVHFLNEEASPGIKRGGVLNVVRHEVELVCPADAIPEFIEADLTGYNIGDSLHISAITLPEGVTPAITDRDFTVATVAAPAGLKEEAEEGEGEGEEDVEETTAEEETED